MYKIAYRHNLYPRDLPDGTIIWTSPTGHTYVRTHRHDLDRRTVETRGERGVMMPRRRHTRAHTTEKAITAERRLNDPLVAERNKPPPY